MDKNYFKKLRVMDGGMGQELHAKGLISKIAQNQIQPHKFCLQTRIAKYKNTKRKFIGMFTSVQG